MKSATARARIAELLDALSRDDLLAIHREVGKRAAPIYAEIHGAKQRQNFRAAMAGRDTRFQRGLSVHENIARNRAAH